MRNNYFIIVVLFSICFFTFYGCANELNNTPLEKSNFQKLTSHEELNEFLDLADSYSEKIKVKKLCTTSELKQIKYVEISADEFGSDTSKLKVLIFAQQHGNEQSGKEASLALIKDIAKGEFDSLLRKIDLIIIPQMNPYGNDHDKRRNKNNADLNRDHLLMNEVEIQSLHDLFHKIMPSVTLDIHEYYPFSKSWQEFGYFKNFDEQFGLVSNPNVDSSIHKFSRNVILPLMKKNVVREGFTFHEYFVGGPPNLYRIRRSATDIDDGRNSFGLLGTFSFILEGKNGRTSLSNIKHRTNGQLVAVKSLLKIIYQKSTVIKEITKTVRSKLQVGNINDEVIIRSEYEGIDGESLRLDLLSTNSNKDTTLIITNYHPVVVKKLSVKMPKGYLIKNNNKLTLQFLRKHKITMEQYDPDTSDTITCYKIIRIEERNNEELDNIYPIIKKYNFQINEDEDYTFIPTHQLASKLLVLALEPQSMLGLVQYENYRQKLIQQLNYQLFRLEY